MARGHGIIINLNTFLPFVFTYNPESVESKKKINYFMAPNIGGSFHEKFFTGFDNKTVNFNLRCVDMESPIGVSDEIAYFESLRQPAPGILDIASAFDGNENYPPPQVLFQFGVSFVPLVWDVNSINIKASKFFDGHLRGLMGIPRMADISIELSLDEDNILYRVQRIADLALSITGSVESVAREIIHKIDNTRKEQPGIFPSQRGSKF
jgi:hypothetical protein